MELLDRYLQAVKKHLPWQRQDDILAELRVNLESQLEDREAELGRPLTTREAEDWLKQIGPPIQIAARYQPQQYLIGPAIFPTYWYVIKLVSLWAIAVYGIVSAIQIFSADNPTWTSALEALLRVPVVLLNTATWVTLIFAVLELVVANYPGVWPGIPGYPVDWSPAKLPALEKDGAPGNKPRSHAQAIAQVIFGFVFLGWLLLIPQYPYLLMGPGAGFLRASPFQLGPAWVAFFWWIVALNVVQLGWRCLDLARGAWQRRRPVQEIAIKLFGLIPFVILLTQPGHLFVTLKHPELDQSVHGATVDTINHGIFHALQVVCVIIVLQLAWEIVQESLKAYRKRIAATL